MRGRKGHKTYLKEPYLKLVLFTLRQCRSTYNFFHYYSFELYQNFTTSGKKKQQTHRRFKRSQHTNQSCKLLHSIASVKTQINQPTSLLYYKILTSSSTNVQCNPRIRVDWTTPNVNRKIQTTLLDATQQPIPSQKYTLNLAHTVSRAHTHMSKPPSFQQYNSHTPQTSQPHTVAYLLIKQSTLSLHINPKCKNIQSTFTHIQSTIHIQHTTDNQIQPLIPLNF